MINAEAREKLAILAEPGDSRGEPKPNLWHIEATRDANVVLDLLCEVGKKVGSTPEPVQLVQHVAQMTKHVLRASASSVFLFDDEERDLLREFTEGQAGEASKQVRLNTESSIAGWVARHGQPLIVNDVTGDQRFNKSVDEITGFVTKSLICVPLILHHKTIGVIEVINKIDGDNFSERDLEAMVSVASTTAISIENVRLNQNVLDSYKSTIKVLAATIEAKDPYTCGHSQRVMEYALLAGTLLPLPAEDLEVLEYAGILHDIGKIGITDSILTKPGPLTPEEWNVMRQHSLIGANILNEIPFLEKARKLILHHHERYDGNGYPDELKGEDIPIGARLLAVADTFDTMTTNRSYRAALSEDCAINELYKHSSTQFCPVAVEAFTLALKSTASETGGAKGNGHHFPNFG